MANDTALNVIKSNRNMLLPIQSEVVIRRLPDVTFFCQKTMIPGITLPSPKVPNPLTAITHPGDHLMWDEFTMEFAVDEMMVNWISIWNWMCGLGFPENTGQHAVLDAMPKYSDLGIRSDVSQLILDSKGIAKIEVTYKDCFPISLSKIEFDTKATEADYVKASVAFAYTSYLINTQHIGS